VFLVYTPDGSDAQRLPYTPRRMLSPEMEAVERVTSRPFSQFTADVLEGSALCRRALLWVLLKRQHPTLKFADVSFAWDELRLEYSRQEYEQFIANARDTLTGDEQAAAVARLEADMVDAIDEDGEQAGKAQLPIAD